MVEITPERIDEHLAFKKSLALLETIQRRFSFDEELKKLKALLNWYIENYDWTFKNAVMKRHNSIGRIRTKIKKDKKLSIDEMLTFFDSFTEKDSMFSEVAIVQFYMAGRVSEPAGLTKNCIHLIKGYLEIKYVAVWGKDKHFIELKDSPKSGNDRYCYYPKVVKEILERRMPKAISFNGHDFLFHKEGRPLSYREIQYHYNKSLKKAGLSDRFSSTQIMRHSMANITRAVTGSLDAAQAVTGHKDQKLVDNLYSHVPSHAQKIAVNDVEKHFMSLNRHGINEVKLAIVK